MRLTALIVLTLYMFAAFDSVSASELPQKTDAFTLLEIIGVFGACLILAPGQRKTTDEMADTLDGVIFQADKIYREKWTTSLFDASRTIFGREPNEFVPIVSKLLAAEPYKMQQAVCDKTFSSVKAWFPPSESETLVKRWLDENNTCRGSSGPASDKACKQREITSGKLSSLGWCYGKNGQVGSDMWWHRCGPNSLR